MRIGLWIFVAFGAILLVCSGALGIAAWLAIVWWPEKPADHRLDQRFSIDDFKIRGEVNTLAFSPDGKYVAAGTRYVGGTAESWEGDFVVWDVQPGKEFHRNHFRQWVQSISIHPSGEFVAISCSSNLDGCPDGFLNFPGLPGEVRVHTFPAMKEIKHIQFDDHLVAMLQYSPDGKSLAVIRQRGTRTVGPAEVVVYDFPAIEERVVVRELSKRQGSGGFPPIAFSPDSSQILTYKYDPPNGDKLITVFNAQSGQLVKLLDLRNIRPQAHMEITKNGIIAVSGPVIDFHDYAKNEYPKQYVSAFKGVRHMAKYATFSPDETQLLGINQKSEGRDAISKVLVHDFPKDELTTVLEQKGVHYHLCRWAPDGKSFAVGTAVNRGIADKEGDPKTGHVLLFKLKNP
jgi:WD40 repeat protein